MIFRSFISLFFILLVSIIVLLDTDIGLNFLIKAIPGKTTTQHVSGTLLHGGTIKKLDYQYDDFSLSIDEISFHWQWPELLKQNLVIDEIKINKIKMHLPKSSSNNSSIDLTSIHLPLNIYLKQLSINHADIHSKEQSYLINTVNLSGKEVNDVITLHQLLVLTPDFSTTSQGEININTWSNINFNNEFVLTSQPDSPILTNIIGDKDLLTISIKSVKWLNINLTVQNYLQPIENIILKSDWFIDTTKAAFPELKKLNGKLLFSAHVNGKLLQPSFDIKLTGRNIFLAETLLNNINVSISGTLKAHKINAALQMLDSNFFSFSTDASFVNKNYYFKQGRFNIEPLNIVLNPINLNINFEKNKTIFYTAKIQHHNELLTLQGDTKYSDLLNLETKASISSNQFTIIDTNAYKIIVNPTLALNYNNNETKIEGALNVVSANIAPIDFSNTVTQTSDIVYVNNQNQPLYQKSVPLRLFLDVLVKIKRLAINYKGIKAEIAGETKLTQTPTTELNAYGQLQILKGSYKAYGQMLTIQKESVINFNREIDNPQLNITASKEIKVSPEYMTLPSYQPYLIAGVQVTGTADEPNIRLFSIPSGVSQQDILSYLIFGFPQNQLSKSQTSALWSAFNMIDTGNSNFSLTGLQKNIQNEFGFSEFGLGSTSEFNAETQQYESGTAFVVGKRITDNLTATYNVGLLVPVNVLYLRYRLSQYWALQSDSSALGNGGDILYTIRRD